MAEKQEDKRGRIKQYLLFNFTTILISVTCLFFAVVVALKDKLLFPALLFGGTGICFLVIFVWDCIKYWRLEMGKVSGDEKGDFERRICRGKIN